MNISLQGRRTFKMWPRGRFLDTSNGNNRRLLITWLWWTLQLKEIKEDSLPLKRLKTIIALALLVLLTGCTPTITDVRLISKTADVLEMSHNNLKLSSRLSNGDHIIYTLEADNGITYDCTAGGNLSAINSINCRILRSRKYQP